MSGETCVKTFSLDVKDSYNLFIGMNNKFEKVTVLRNKSFNSEHVANPDNLSKKLMRILVTSMNEGSPKYGEVCPLNCIAMFCRLRIF